MYSVGFKPTIKETQTVRRPSIRRVEIGETDIFWALAVQG